MAFVAKQVRSTVTAVISAVREALDRAHSTFRIMHYVSAWPAGSKLAPSALHAVSQHGAPPSSAGEEGQHLRSDHALQVGLQSSRAGAGQLVPRHIHKTPHLPARESMRCWVMTTCLGLNHRVILNEAPGDF